MSAQSQIFSSTLILFTSGLLSLVSAVVVVTFQPYRVKTHNTIDSVLLSMMGMYFVCYYTQIALLTEGNSDANVALTLQMFFVAPLLLYFVSLIVQSLFGRQLQAAIRKAKMMWNSTANHSRDHSAGEVIESFDRGLDTSESNSYTPLLGGSQKPTY